MRTRIRYASQYYSLDACATLVGKVLEPVIDGVKAHVEDDMRYALSDACQFWVESMNWPWEMWTTIMEKLYRKDVL